MVQKIKITFLGTSAQIPTAKRNHTAILINWDNENILVDCGEGTQRQFRKARLNPCKVNRILITHQHGDHIFGLPGLLSTFENSGYSKTLHIYGPRGIKNFLHGFLGFVKTSFEIKIEEVSGKFFETKDFYLEAEKMEHGIPTNAYAFFRKGQLRIDKTKLKKSKLPSGPLLKKLKEGKDIVHDGKKFSAKEMTYTEGDRKISFVLDTLENKKIVPFVKDSDLLICEASFDDEIKELAKEHFHLTAKQAGEIARKAGVKKLILTHLSQRYEQEKSKILDEAKKSFKEVTLAEDFDSFEI